MAWHEQFTTLDYRGVALGIGIGIAGGLLFSWLSTPMPWMLGSMLACLVAALFGLPLTSPIAFRPPMTAMIGVMMGAGYTPALLGQLGSWWITILGLVLFMGVAGLVCVGYFRIVAKYDAATAYFCGMPGGLMEMVLLGEASGADMRKVALVHSARIVFTVSTIPFIVQWVEGRSIVRGAATNVSLLGMDWAAWGWLGFTLGAGLLLGRLVSMPSRYLMGPLIISVAVHLSGLSSFKPPWELILVAQLVLGTVIGCRFAGSNSREVLRVLLVSLGSCALMIALSIGFALLVSRLTDHTLIELMLAYSPGGLAEMGLLAVAFNLEIAFVSTHHILRIAFVVIAAPAFMGLARIHRKTVG